MKLKDAIRYYELTGHDIFSDLKKQKEYMKFLMLDFDLPNDFSEVIETISDNLLVLWADSHEITDETALPTNEELDELDKFELFIESNLTQNKIKNYYVFRDTHKGIRNFYIVTNDNNGATEVIKLIKNSGKQRPFEFEIITDKTWNLYNEFRKKMPKE